MSGSRFASVDDENGIGPGLWAYHLRRATASKRGQAFLRELLAALDAVPGHRLIGGSIKAEGSNVCALGAYAAWREMRERGITWRGAVRELPYGGGEQGWATTCELIRDRYGVAWTLAYEIAEFNDENAASATLDPADRWRDVRAYVAGLIVGEVA